MESYFNNSNLIGVILKWKKTLIIVTILTITLSVIFSSEYFIKPKFKSTAILYPANIIPFSSESQTEQMMQLLQSSDIRDQIIKKYKLYDYYNLDTSAKEIKTKIVKLYNEDVSFTKTQFESVDVSVYNTKPQLACDIVNDIIDLYNKKTKELHVSKAKEKLEGYKIQLNSKKAEMDSMENALQELRDKYGLLDYKLQTREATRGFLRSAGSDKKATTLMNNLVEKGGSTLTLTEHLWRIRGAYNDIKEKYEEVLREVNENFTYANIVTKPFPADKKSYPIRWLIVLISTISTFLFTIIILLGLENYKGKIDI